MIPKGTVVKYVGNVIAWQGYDGLVVGHGAYNDTGPELNIIEFDIIDYGNSRYFPDTDLRVVGGGFEVVPVAEEKDTHSVRAALIVTDEDREVATYVQPDINITPMRIGDSFHFEGDDGYIVNIHKNGDFWVAWLDEDEDADLHAEFFLANGDPAYRHVMGAGPERHPSSQKFHDWLREAGELHDKKQGDYGTTDDPFANVRRCEQYGIPGWIGCAIRMGDKVARIEKAVQNYIETGDHGLLNETLEDSFNDLGVYAGIGAVLLRESNED